MNTRLFSILFALLLCVACSNENDSITTPNNDSTPYFVELVKSVDIPAAHYKAILEEYAEEAIDIPVVDGNITVDVINYNTVLPNGEDVVASGILLYRKDMPIKGVVMVQHFTITANYESPSESLLCMEGAYNLMDNFALIVPDYIGFGATVEHPHPYMHYESTAQVSIDMYFAVREYTNTLEHDFPFEKGMSVIGYSQGGAAAIGFQKMAETKYPEINLKQVFSGGGAIDLIAVADAMKKTNYSLYPCSLPYIFMGLNYADDLQIELSEVFKGDLAENYEEWFYSKKYNSVEVNRFIGTPIISDYIADDFFTNTPNPTIEKMEGALQRNSLVKGWTPKTPIFLTHVANDTYVPVVGSRNAYLQFIQLGCDVTYNEPEEGDHDDYFLQFFIDCFERLMISY
ncbi:MAG: lipase family protein [Tannerellaceae bacterium]